MSFATNDRHSRDLTVMKVDGSSSFLTISEHLKRGGKELAGCDLSGMSFDGLSFRGAFMSEAKLDGSSFIDCDFSDADLTDTSAQNCDFRGVQFGGGQIVRTAFNGWNLQGARFFQVHEIEASTNSDSVARFASYDGHRQILDESVKTGKTRLQDTIFDGCDLRGAVFIAPPTSKDKSVTTKPLLGVSREVPLYIRQRFSSCMPKTSSFKSCNMHEVDLQGFYLGDCDFSGAHLQGVNLNGAKIHGLDLSSCNLINANLHCAHYDDATKFPEGYPVPPDAVRDEQGKHTKRKEKAQVDDGDYVIFLALVLLALFIAVLVIAASQSS